MRLGGLLVTLGVESFLSDPEWSRSCRTEKDTHFGGPWIQSGLKPEYTLGLCSIKISWFRARIVAQW